MSTNIERQHASMVAALKKPGYVMAREQNDDDCDLNHMAMGICGEAGELIDAIKKHTIYRKPLNLENVVEELGDIEFFLEGLRQRLGVSRETCLQANYDKLSKRYAGLQYSDQQAQDRADKEQ